MIWVLAHHAGLPPHAQEGKLAGRPARHGLGPFWLLGILGHPWKGGWNPHAPHHPHPDSATGTELWPSPPVAGGEISFHIRCLVTMCP